MASTKGHTTNTRQGAVLIVAIGILTVLGVMALLFASTTKVERVAASNYVDMVRSKILAQSGIECAISRIQNKYTLGTIVSQAEDESSDWVYGKPSAPAYANAGIPIEEAIYVSWGTTGAAGPTTAPYTLNSVRIKDRTNTALRANFGVADPYLFGYTSRLPATYGGGMDYYAIKVVDLQALVYINGPDTNDTNPNSTVARTVSNLAPNLTLLLNNLGSQLAIPNLANRIQSHRMALGRNIENLDEMANPPASFTTTQLTTLKGYLTAHAFVDRTVLHPDALERARPNDPNLRPMSIPISSRPDPRGGTELVYWQPGNPMLDENGDVNKWAGCPGAVVADRTYSDDTVSQWVRNQNTAETPSPSSGSANASQGPFLQPRAPINVNLADQVVLTACLTGIAGRFIQHAYSSSSGMTYMGSQPAAPVAISSAQASQIAAAIITYRRSLMTTRGYGFATWYDWQKFIDTDSTVSTQTGGLSATGYATRELLKAHFNPNSRINKLNPDRTTSMPHNAMSIGMSYHGPAFGQLDKSDITTWTTEFCFNSMGHFRVESIGRVLAPTIPANPNGLALIAERKITTEMKVYETFKHSTQKEFFVNRAVPSGFEATCMLHPESLTDLGPGLFNVSSSSNNNPQIGEWDGQISSQTMDYNGGLMGTQTFRASYTNSFGLARTANGQDNEDKFGPAERSCSVIDFSNGGTPAGGSNSEIFPDGLFAHETRRYPTYSQVSRYGANTPYCNNTVDDYVRYGNANSKINMVQGTIEMWVKPTWSATEFPDSVSGALDNPRPEGRRTFFSVGPGKAHSGQSLVGNAQSLPDSDNRICLFAGRENSGVAIFGFQATRHTPLNSIPNVPGVTAGSSQNIDRGSSTGSCRPNYYLVPITPEGNYPGFANGPGSWNARNWKYPGVWHHVRFTWMNSNTSWLHVDGQTADFNGMAAVRCNGLANVNAAWSMFVGSCRFNYYTDNALNTPGYPLNADATLDDVRIDSTPIAAGNPLLPPDRFNSQFVYESKIGPPASGAMLDATDTVMPYGGKVAYVAWTGYYPKYQGQSSNISVQIGPGAPTYNIVNPSLPNPNERDLWGRGATSAPGNTINFNAGDQLRYRVTMSQNGGGANFIQSSCALDDLSIVVLPSSGALFLYYAIE